VNFLDSASPVGYARGGKGMQATDSAYSVGVASNPLTGFLHFCERHRWTPQIARSADTRSWLSLLAALQAVGAAAHAIVVVDDSA